MRILGIDPGFAIVGYGILDYNNVKFDIVSYGSIKTSSNDKFEDRINTIYDDMMYLISKYRPDTVSIEKLFFTSNQKTGIDVSQARGVILLAARKSGIKIVEYTPLQVKQSVVGYGRADKNQVINMVKSILKLQTLTRLDDIFDALALAICHGNSCHSVTRFYDRG